MRVRDRAPTRDEVEASAAPFEAELEALFREIRRDAIGLVASARTPQEALTLASGIMAMELEVEGADT